MEITWEYVVGYGLSAIALGVFGGWLGYNPSMIAAVSVVGTPVAGIGLLALLSIFSK
jgi:hydrogenase/urease accessory protein HupE